MDDTLSKAIRLAGGPAAVGRLFGITSQAVSQWRRCPPERVRALCAATRGEVTEAQLRPDLYGASSAADAGPQGAAIDGALVVAEAQ